MIRHDSAGRSCEVCGHGPGTEVARWWSAWLCYGCAAWVRAIAEEAGL